MARRVLNELVWHPQKNLEGVEIVYIHRGATDDRRKVLAQSISDIGKSFFIIKTNNRDTQIPYHRIVEIRRPGEILWRKKSERN